MAEAENKNHFVLVHGVCHGAWNWFKLKTQPESAGHRVTLLDLAASGVNMKAIHDAIVVGHGLGGLNLALTMDLFPRKISVGVVFSAFMPDTIHQPSYLVDKDHCFIKICQRQRSCRMKGYGSVTRVFFVCDRDQAMNIELQGWMINNDPPKAVLEIKGAEHMPMFSKTKQLCDVLIREKEFETEGLKKRRNIEKREKRNQRS
ncbi:hypothetical protein J1N35_025219 [Gossypium stocksii]|uniref:AB hydrolase-1 domain-containing protein n=1 Tax=Gossypium stocksii TaxID=47602 RepID=A0A9D3V771_9ROSI|nr:hypothetical protein J1N35_025219 [Gossypium stocksii]